MTKLKQWRLRRGLSQDALAAAIGVSRTTYQKLESDEDNPRVRVLVNCAHALGCELTDLLEDEWLTWRAFDLRKNEPPDPKDLWREHD